MKNPINILITTGAIALAVAALAGATVQQGGMSCCGGMMAMKQDSHHPAKPVRAKQFEHKQTATVLIDGGYSPSVIEVKRGKPVELTFKGGKNIGCGGTVVFKTLKLSGDCATGKSVTLKFTPKSKGEIPFTCGMGMYKGKVIVK
jgi:plastocyanin domain-containing protein